MEREKIIQFVHYDLFLTNYGRVFKKIDIGSNEIKLVWKDCSEEYNKLLNN